MKRIKFEEVTDGRIRVSEVNDKGLKEDGSAIKMSYSLLEEALEQGVFKSRTYGKGDTIFYNCEDITLLRVKDNDVIVLDSKINGIEISEILDKKSISINRNQNDRGICRVNLSKVTHYSKNKKEIVESKNYPVSINLVLWDIKLGKTNCKVKDIKRFDIVEREGHHERADWDNRVTNTVVLTTEAHKEHHKVHGKNSHQTVCKISNVEELKALIEYLRTYN